MRLAKSILLATTLLASATFSARAEVKVVASIKPVHSLVAAVMEGVGTPGLIIEGAGSPHTYSLKPSQAQMLESADVVFWVGHELEAFLEKPLETISANAKSVELIDAHGLRKLGFREGGAFEAHEHEGHDEHGHDDHAHDEHDHDEHDHEKHAHDEHDHDEHDHEKHAHDEHDKDDHGHGDHHGEFDPHIWLDPVNAKALVHEIEEALVALDPANASRYEANAHELTHRLESLVTEVEGEVAPVRGKAFIVFHDAYHYFEHRFDMEAAGSITVSPEVMPGAERIGEIKEKILSTDAVCVFAEPQFEPKLVATVSEGTKAKAGILDPLGAELKDGPELYFDLIRGMAASFKNCLSQSS